MHSLYAGLVSYWNLHDQSGSRLDLTGNANTLTNTNTVTSVDGLVGAASNFVLASSQRLQIASNATIQGGPKDYTFAFWTQLTTKPGTDMYLVSKYSAVSGQAEYEILWNTSADRFVMNVYRATDSVNFIRGDSFGAPSTGVWYFVCGWNDNVNLTSNIEINAGVTDSQLLGGTTQAASAAVLALGSRGATGTGYLNGKMADVGRWDRVLTRQERTWLYNKGNGQRYPFDAYATLGQSRYASSRRAVSVL